MNTNVFLWFMNNAENADNYMSVTQTCWLWNTSHKMFYFILFEEVNIFTAAWWSEKRKWVNFRQDEWWTRRRSVFAITVFDGQNRQCWEFKNQERLLIESEGIRAEVMMLLTHKHTSESEARATKKRKKDTNRPTQMNSLSNNSMLIFKISCNRCWNQNVFLHHW